MVFSKVVSTLVTRGGEIKALAPWFGGKRNLAPQIVELLGDHKVYWEPFCGSMAVLFSKPICVMETVNDLHGDLINLARVVQDKRAGKQLYDLLMRTFMHEGLFQEAAERLQGTSYECLEKAPNLGRAHDFMLGSWCGRNGVAGTAFNSYNFCVRFTSGGGHAAKRWRSVITSIPVWHYRLQNVVILQRDAFEVLERIEDKPKTVIYVDPPYIVKTVRYVYDFQLQDHSRLAELLSRFKQTRVVLSYYDHPLLTELYPHWLKKKIEVNKFMACRGARGKGNIKATEVLLTNR